MVSRETSTACIWYSFKYFLSSAVIVLYSIVFYIIVHIYLFRGWENPHCFPHRRRALSAGFRDCPGLQLIQGQLSDARLLRMFTKMVSSVCLMFCGISQTQHRSQALRYTAAEEMLLVMDSGGSSIRPLNKRTLTPPK